MKVFELSKGILLGRIVKVLTAGGSVRRGRSVKQSLVTAKGNGISSKNRLNSRLTLIGHLPLGSGLGLVWTLALPLMATSSTFTEQYEEAFNCCIAPSTI